MNDINIRRLQRCDETKWKQLFSAYRDFYELPQSDELVNRVWGWLNDPEHESQGLIGEIDGEIYGFGHWRRFSRPSTGSIGIWLDDLYTDSAVRGRGLGRAIIQQLTAVAASEGRSVVRWITKEDNRQAQILYDSLATRTDWVTYDATPDHKTDDEIES